MPHHQHKKRIRKHAITAFLGLSVVLVVVFAVGTVSLTAMSKINERTKKLVDNNYAKSRAMNVMFESVRERTLLLYAISLNPDPFVLEELADEMSAYAGQFIAAREELYQLLPVPEELEELESQRDFLFAGQTIISESLRLLRAEEFERAVNSLTQARYMNNAVLVKLDKMRQLHHKISSNALIEAEEAYTAARGKIYLLNGAAVLICLVILGSVVYNNVTQARLLAEAAEELEVANQLLESRVAERTKEMRIARDEALEANQTKSRFLANMSHELRTPLNAVIGYSEMLKEEFSELEEHEYAVKDLTKIEMAGKHLLNLVNDVLDISKIEAGKMELDPTRFKLLPMLIEINDTLQPLAQQHRNQLNFDVDESITDMFADEMRLRQVLYNLLSNACKFTKDGEVSLIVKPEIREDDPWVLFSVCDTGIGISKEQQDKLFQAFTQVDASTTRKYGGTGLGLVISLHFCQMMGGTIEVDSVVGEGSTFTIHLPQYVHHDEGAHIL